MAKKIFIGLGVVLAGLLVMVAIQPSEFRVERSTLIHASPDAVTFHIVNFHRWEAWSPWEKMDPNMKKTFSGPTDGVGAMYAWEGNDKVGKGKMTLVEYEPARHVGIRLEFLAPWQATNKANFDLAPEGEETKITWGMDGHHSFMGKAFSLFMDMDAMIGKDFEQGLASLKKNAEK